MALPEQLVDRLSREPVQTPGWASQLLMFSGTVFFISLAIYVGLVFGYKPFLEKEVSRLDNQIKTFIQQIPPEEQNNLISFYSQTINLQNILGGHVISSQLFVWLEKKTETNIYYAKFNFVSPTKQLNLTGVSKTIDDFSKQALAFQNDPIVKRISINSFTVSPGGLWQFDITLFMADGYLSQAEIKQ